MCKHEVNKISLKKIWALEVKDVKCRKKLKLQYNNLQ